MRGGKIAALALPGPAMNQCADPCSTCTAFAPTLPHQFLLVFDRSLAVNTAAAGAIVSLLTIG